MDCPVCDQTFDDSDLYLIHLVEHKREMMKDAGMLVELKLTEFKPDYKTFVREWLEAHKK